MSSGFFVGKTNFCLIGFKISLILCLRGNFNMSGLGGGGEVAYFSTFFVAYNYRSEEASQFFFFFVEIR